MFLLAQVALRFGKALGDKMSLLPVTFLTLSQLANLWDASQFIHLTEGLKSRGPFWRGRESCIASIVTLPSVLLGGGTFKFLLPDAIVALLVSPIRLKIRSFTASARFSMN